MTRIATVFGFVGATPSIKQITSSNRMVISSFLFWVFYDWYKKPDAQNWAAYDDIEKTCHHWKWRRIWPKIISANDVTYDDVINGRQKLSKNCVKVYSNAKFELSATFGCEVRLGGGEECKFPPAHTQDKVHHLENEKYIKRFKKIL